MTIRPYLKRTSVVRADRGTTVGDLIEQEERMRSGYSKFRSNLKKLADIKPGKLLLLEPDEFVFKAPSGFVRVKKG